LRRRVGEYFVTVLFRRITAKTILSVAVECTATGLRRDRCVELEKNSYLDILGQQAAKDAVKHTFEGRASDNGVQSGFTKSNDYRVRAIRPF
jgi:hypothetical protein